MTTQDNDKVDETVLAALNTFIGVLRQSGQQPDQSYKLETAGYFDGLRTRFHIGDNQERISVLDEITRTGKVTDLGLTADELDAYKKVYSAVENAISGVN